MTSRRDTSTGAGKSMSSGPGPLCREIEMASSRSRGIGGGGIRGTLGSVGGAGGLGGGIAEMRAADFGAGRSAPTPASFGAGRSISSGLGATMPGAASGSGVGPSSS